MSRPASAPQLYSLSRIGALKLQPAGGDPLTYEDAWTALQDAAAAGLWKPTRSAQEAAEAKADRPRKHKAARVPCKGSRRDGSPCTTTPGTGWDYCWYCHDKQVDTLYRQWQEELQNGNGLSTVVLIRNCGTATTREEQAALGKLIAEQLTHELDKAA